MSIITARRTAISVAAVAAAALTVAPVAAHAAGTAPAATTSTRVAAAAPLWDTHYLVAGHTGSTAKLLLVNRSTGAVARTVATAPMGRYSGGSFNPFYDARIARDGSVWYIKGDGTTYGRSLMHVVGGRSQQFMPYAASFALSDDGRRVAVTVVSPDTNHDGKGATTVRVLASSGRGPVTTIASYVFPVNHKGAPAVEYIGPWVNTWVGSSRVLISRGCCDSNALSAVPADRAVPEKAWPSIEGSAATSVIGHYRDGSVLALHDELPGGASELLHITPARPKGTRVALLDQRTTGTDIARHARIDGATLEDVEMPGVVAEPPRGVVVDEVLLTR